VVLLGNLFPAEAGVEELDSHMFQTVGHTAVEAYAACVGVPMLRRRIRGASLQARRACCACCCACARACVCARAAAAVACVSLAAVSRSVCVCVRARNTSARSRLEQLGLEYAPAPGDEVEDLRALLAAAKAAVPDLGGVCSGAILSDYQRLRVEAVASSLGLVSLAYLWRRNQASLLAEMAAAPLDAVLIKVAALGLSPARHLGRRLAALTPALVALEQRYGCHAAGEGGEYETMTLDCPAFRRGRLVIDASHVVTEPGSSAGGAEVGHLVIDAWHVERKTCGGDAEEGDAPSVTMVDEEEDGGAAVAAPAALGDACAGAEVRVTRGGAAWTFSARAAPASSAGDAHASASAAPEAAAAAQVASQLLAVGASLSREGLTWSDALFVTLHLADMSHFSACNAAYNSIVPRTAPPARACIAAPLLASSSAAAFAQLDVLARSPACAAAAIRRAALHVQSISCWAPACIGPYAQANRCGGLVFLAGQLGLDPPTMALRCGPDGAPDAPSEASAAVAAAVAVAAAMHAPLHRAAAGAILYATSAGGADALAGAWEDMLAGRVPPRPGFGPDGKGLPAEASADDADAADADADDADDAEVVRARAWPWAWRPLLAAVRVPALPRGAAVELQPLAFAPDADAWRSNDGDDAADDDAADAASRASGDATSVWVPGRFCRAHGACGAVDAGAEASPRAAADVTVADASAAVASLHAALCRASLTWHDVCSLRVYHVAASLDARAEEEAALRRAWASALAQHCSGDDAAAVAPVFVPVLGVASAGGPRLRALAELTAWRPAQLDTRRTGMTTRE
jgi:diphthine-ammonia ligase